MPGEPSTALHASETGQQAPSQRTPRPHRWRLWVAFGVVVALVSVLLQTLAPDQLIHVEAAGRRHALHIPGPAIRLSSGSRGYAVVSGYAVYGLLGDRDLHDHLRTKAAADGWQYREQLGSMHVLQKPGFMLYVQRRQWGASFIILLHVEVVLTGAVP